jgi:hypothetical protein
MRLHELRSVPPAGCRRSVGLTRPLPMMSGSAGRQRNGCCLFARESFTEQLTTRAAEENVHLLTAADLFAS